MVIVPFIDINYWNSYKFIIKIIYETPDDWWKRNVRLIAHILISSYILEKFFVLFLIDL